MHSIDHLRALFEYDAWADRKTIAALEAAESEGPRKILAHLLTTKQEYFERLDGKDSTDFDFWPNLSLDECRQRAQSTHENSARILSSPDDDSLDRVAKYKTSEGIAYENTYRELLTHVLIHASIHRGNIVIEMREEGLEPPKIDYILYIRESR